MTTRLTRPVVRLVETSATVRSASGALVVTLTPAGLLIREKGRRTSYGPIPYGHLLLEGARRTAASRIAERQRGRTAKVKRSML